MTSTEGTTFPAVDAEKQLDPGKNKDFEADSVSSQVAAPNEIEEQAEAAKKQRDKEKKDAMQTLKSTLIVSGIVVAVAGAIFAITRKLREK